MNPRYEIFGRTATGDWMLCFTWTRDAASGIARAEREAKEFGFEIAEFEARPIL